MAACETCWTEASRRAAYTGRHTADIYHEVLRENEGWAPHDAPCGGVAENPGHWNAEAKAWEFEDNDPKCCEVHMLPWGHKALHPHDS